jgi:hypothetical protein
LGALKCSQARHCLLLLKPVKLQLGARGLHALFAFGYFARKFCFLRRHALALALQGRHRRCVFVSRVGDRLGLGYS